MPAAESNSWVNLHRLNMPLRTGAIIAGEDIANVIPVDIDIAVLPVTMGAERRPMRYG